MYVSHQKQEYGGGGGGGGVLELCLGVGLMPVSPNGGVGYSMILCVDVVENVIVCVLSAVNNLVFIFILYLYQR